MSMTLDVPSVIESRVVNYEKLTGRSVRQMLIDYLQKELDRADEGQLRVKRFRELLSRKTKLTGTPYRFRRQDAYDEALG